NARVRDALSSPQYWNSSAKSRYHVVGLSLRARTASIERGPTVIGPSPGGAPMHFWLHDPAASTPNASRSSGMPPSDVTQSMATRAPYRLATSTISAIG